MVHGPFISVQLSERAQRASESHRCSEARSDEDSTPCPVHGSRRERAKPGGTRNARPEDVYGGARWDGVATGEQGGLRCRCRCVENLPERLVSPPLLRSRTLAPGPLTSSTVPERPLRLRSGVSAGSCRMRSDRAADEPLPLQSDLLRTADRTAASLEIMVWEAPSWNGGEQAR
jgi:hypothetical protein